MARLISRVKNGVLVGDQRLDQVLLLQDIDGDGNATDSGEATVFFDETNASGLALPTNNVFTVHQASDKSVYVGDGTADAVYKLNDKNDDGDAQDEGEAQVWFSDDNAAGFSTVTPNGIYEGPDGAIYITNAGTRSAPQDAIYRTVDLNGDGDANDAGEATYRAQKGALPQNGTSVSRRALAQFLIDAIEAPAAGCSVFGVSRAAA